MRSAAPSANGGQMHGGTAGRGRGRDAGGAREGARQMAGKRRANGRGGTARRTGWPMGSGRHGAGRLPSPPGPDAESPAPGTVAGERGGTAEGTPGAPGASRRRHGWRRRRQCGRNGRRHTRPEWRLVRRRRGRQRSARILNGQGRVRLHAQKRRTGRRRVGRRVRQGHVRRHCRRRFRGRCG